MYICATTVGDFIRLNLIDGARAILKIDSRRKAARALSEIMRGETRRNHEFRSEATPSSCPLGVRLSSLQQRYVHSLCIYT